MNGRGTRGLAGAPVEHADADRAWRVKEDRCPFLEVLVVYPKVLSVTPRQFLRWCRRRAFVPNLNSPRDMKVVGPAGAGPRCRADHRDGR